MQPEPLETILAEYAAQPLPRSLEPSAAAVWREIENRRTQSWRSRVFPHFDWLELFGRPGFVLAGVALALVAGAMPAVAMERVEKQRELARLSIHFEVFSSQTELLGSVFAKPIALVGSARP